MRKNYVAGITLIALVVTIIVLLILSGISIQMLTGDNGILSRAGQVKEMTEKEEAREKLGLEVLGVLDNYGNINLQTLTTKLASINADVTSIEYIIEDDAQTGKITLNGYAFYIDNHNNVLDYLGPEMAPKPNQNTTKETLNRANGKIDIVFLNETGYNITETPNKPELDDTMVPVYYDTIASAWKVCSDTDITNWYKYEAEDVSKAGTSAGDTHKNRWANVMLTDLIEVEKDGTTYTTEQIKTLLTENNLSQIVGATVTKEGSMLVWIPRYAYKITYYSTSAKLSNEILGYSDSRGFVYTDGTYPKNMQVPTISINVNGTIGNTTYEYYRPHPAFEKDVSQGGWGKKITGIWIGKFEATGSKNSVTTISTANTSALRSQTIGILWNALKNNFSARTTESHMMKNSEWGACIYLAESKFGRNEVAITKNVSSNYYTGAGNYKGNQDQSTTGNIYGVYDTVGGAYEYVASYIPNEQTSYGNQFASIDETKNNKTESTPYSTVYKYDSTEDNYTNNYNANLNRIFGDAICETSIRGSGTTSWHEANSYFAYTSKPTFTRGGCNSYGASSSFFFTFSDGNMFTHNSSRVVCIVK